MTLLDDNFASIVAAVEEGRGVFDNITKFIVWILPTNIGEAAMLITAILLGLPLPALPLQLLWVNLTDTLLGLPLAFEPKEPGLMRRPPRNPSQPLLTHPLIMRTGLVTLIILIGGLALFLWELRAENSGLAVARTVVVNLFVVVEALYLFNCRSLTRSFVAINLFGNRLVLYGVVLMMTLQLFFTYAPVMNELFHTGPVTVAAWLRIAAVAGLAFAAVEFEKWIRFGRIRGEYAIPN
jgi:magnesium-transporting ATPase (P-type)